MSSSRQLCKEAKKEPSRRVVGEEPEEFNIEKAKEILGSRRKL